MSDSTTNEPASRELFDHRFMVRLCTLIAALAILSGGIHLGGKWLGRQLALGGHSESTALHEIVIGNNVLRVPENAIRNQSARVDGVAERLDVYLLWPTLEGFTSEQRAAFNNRDGAGELLFLTFEESAMSLDMTGRLEPVYRGLIERASTQAGHGLTAHRFTERSGYVDEELIVGGTPEPFVARCLIGAAGEASLAPCQRDIRLGDGLSLTYRFPRRLLAQWAELESAVRSKALSWLQKAS